jgi:hypothetical protein
VIMPEPPPDTSVTWLVTPPAPHHRYNLAEIDISLPSNQGSFIKSIPYRDSFIVYMDVLVYNNRITVVPFKSSGSEKPFCLFLGQADIQLSSWEAAWATAISQTESNPSLGSNSKLVGASYSRILDGGETVHVTSWRNRDKSIADLIVKLSI